MNAFSIVATTIAVMAVWSRLGSKRLARSGAAPLYRTLEKTMLAALGLAAILAGLGAVLMPSAGAVWDAVFGALLATPVLVHTALDPTRRGFWHHRRVRPVAITALLAVGAALGYVLPDPVLAAPLMAALAFHRHMGALQAIAADAHEELAAIRHKLVSHAAAASTARHTTPVTPVSSKRTPFSADDKLPKAG